MSTKPLIHRQNDPRWQILAHIQTAREAIGIKSRSLTVLRGLLSFVTLPKWEAGELIVFPSNRALQERCDGMDERTMRRHLSHLISAGVIQRKMSPNRKRYAVRDENGRAIMCYGFDLSGLKAHADRIEQLATEAKQQALRIRSLRSVLRHLLWETANASPDLMKMLRNKVSVESLETAIASLTDPSVLSDRDGQNDRHIQNSDKEYIEEYKEDAGSNELTAIECINATPGAMELSLEPVRNWPELDRLANTLAPALGVKPELQRNAVEALGNRGFTLAILGMVEAIERIKSAPNYLAALSAKSRDGALNAVKMFRSLTRTNRFPAGNRVIIVG